MASLKSGATCLRIKPLSILRRPGSEWSWKYYEFSITIFREEEGGERELPLFNSDLIENPFKHSVDTNSISAVFSDALKTGGIAHFYAFEEMNFFISIYPYVEARWAAENELMIIFQIQENTFSHAGYDTSGPACIMYVDRSDIEEFHRKLLEEEMGAFK